MKSVITIIITAAIASFITKSYINTNINDLEPQNRLDSIPVVDSIQIRQDSLISALKGGDKKIVSVIDGAVNTINTLKTEVKILKEQVKILTNENQILKSANNNNRINHVEPVGFLPIEGKNR